MKLGLRAAGLKSRYSKVVAVPFVDSSPVFVDQFLWVNEHVGAVPVVAGAPTFGAPTLAIVGGVLKVLTAAALLDSAPTFGAKPVRVRHVLTAAGKTVPAPTLGRPACTQNNVAPVFSFSDVYANPSTSGVVGSAAVYSISGSTLVTVSGGVNAQVSSDGSNWGSSATLSGNGSTVYVRQDAPSGFSSSNTCYVTINGLAVNYTVRTGSAPSFSFASAIVLPGSGYNVASHVVSGLYGSATASVSGGNGSQVSNNGSSWGSSATIAAGGTVFVRQNASGLYDTTTVATVTILGTGSTFSLQTCKKPTFTALSDTTNGTPFSYSTVSTTMSNCNLNGSTISVSGGTNAQISINGGSTWGTSFTWNGGSGGTIMLRQTCPQQSQSPSQASINLQDGAVSWKLSAPPAVVSSIWSDLGSGPPFTVFDNDHTYPIQVSGLLSVELATITDWSGPIATSPAIRLGYSDSMPWTWGSSVLVGIDDRNLTIALRTGLTPGVYAWRVDLGGDWLLFMYTVTG